MSTRGLPRWDRADPPSATKLNQLSTEIGRLAHLDTGGEDLFVDNAVGKFRAPRPAAAATAIYPMVVTETAYGTYEYGPGFPYAPSQDAAITRTSHIGYGFAAKRLDSNLLENGSTIDVRAEFLVNVLHTGDRFFAVRFGGEYYAVHTGNSLWSEAVTQEAFNTRGLVELYENGPIVEAHTDTPIPDATACDVEFDDHEQIYKIVAQRCPTEPEVGYGYV